MGGLPCLSPGDLPTPGTEPRSPSLQADSLASDPPGKPKNTAVGSLFLLQGIFLTQELNWGRLHCRWILYQLSFQGSSIVWAYDTVTQFKIFSNFYLEDSCITVYNYRASLEAQLVKNLPAMQETLVLFWGWEGPPKKGKATHSSILT